MRRARALWIAMRPYQWVKNVIVFTALVFGGHLVELHDLLLMVLGFVAFCFVASAVYLLNDVRDAPLDRLHPEKRLRPVAAGDLPAGSALTAAGFLGAVGLGGAVVLPALDPTPAGYGFPAFLGLYALQNVLYTWWLKERAVLDVLVIAVGFVLRILAGGALIGVEISHWALICTFFLALFLALGKRRSELAVTRGEGEVRPSLRGYPPAFLDQMLAVVLSATVVTYTLYTVSEKVRVELRAPYLYSSLVFVVYGLFRYLYLIHRRRGGDPARTLMRDRPLLVTATLWGLTVILCLYVFRGP